MRSTRITHALFSAATAITLISSGAAAQTESASPEPLASSPPVASPEPVASSAPLASPAPSASSAPPIDPDHTMELHERAAEVRAACMDARATDWALYVSTGVTVIGGATLAIYAVRDPRGQRPYWNGFLLGFGGAMLLGGVGVPFSRGIFRSRDPLYRACDAVMSAWPPRENLIDVTVAARMFEERGEPDKPIIWIALSIGTAVTGGLIALSAALQSYDLLSISGGLAAGVGVGWLAMIPTPVRRASIRFRQGLYRRRHASFAPSFSVAAAPIPGGAGLSFVGEF